MCHWSSSKYAGTRNTVVNYYTYFSIMVLVLTPFDETTLKHFLASKNWVNLNITIFAQDKFLKCINGTILQLINNPKVPPDPLIPLSPPTPIPDPDPNHSTSGFNTTWIVFTVFRSIFILTGVAYLRYHRKKKCIGGLKRNINTKKIK
ncbi:hypothetical protein [Spiroplasma endosymbiont of Nomada ruficornis]|uniref:hypothetical protein n=2 Tax=unclassified Spiroplasma TaxID=2637901 RepID=UPI00313AA037